MLSLDTNLARPALVSVSREQQLPSSFAQQRLWLLDHIDGGSAHYNMPAGLTLTGELNAEALTQALTSILERHESLRTYFIAGEDSQPLQIIRAPAPFVLPFTDLSGLPEGERQLQQAQLIAEEAEREFDLSHDLMLRAQLIKIAADEHILLVTMHHIASDGWSMGILINEFSTLYSAYAQGQENPLPPLAIQYADYAHWQRNWLQGEVLDKQLGYWTTQLAGLPVVHNLPLDHARPTAQSFAGHTIGSHIDADTRNALMSLCKAQGATLFMGLHAAFSVLLSRHSNETDIVMGSPIANREQAEVANLIGFFVNTLVLRSDLSGNPGFTDLLQQSKAMLLDAYAHQQVPFEQLVERLQPERSLSHSPLFQVMLVLQNNEEGELTLPGLTLGSVESGGAGIAKFDLTLNITESEEGLWLGWEYNTDLFEESTVERMAGHFGLLLESLVVQPDVSVFRAEMLPAEERQQLLVEFNNTAVDYPTDKCIHELFEAQANTNPDAIAVIFEGQHLTYQQLNTQANRLAHYLITEKQVKPDTLVGICVERSLEMVVGILAILKAGGAYVPLDPEYPEARLAYMLDDAKLTTVLTQRHLRETTPVSDEQAVCLDDETLQHHLHTHSTHNPDPNTSGLTSSHLAYVIYTSGSTGNPKGVMVEHYNVTRLMDAAQQHFEFTVNDVWTLFHSYAFDFSVWELWGAITKGGRVVIVPYWISRSPSDFYELLVREKVTVLNQTPSAFTALIHEDAQRHELLALRYVVFGGEALNLASLGPWFDSHGDQQPQLINMYGITETTVHVTYCQITRDIVAGVTGASVIGSPLADLQLLILNEQQKLVPIGVAGEMYVGGAGVTRGYLNQPSLTDSRFVLLPEFGEQRFYRTGDLARYLPDGQLDYVGRIDHQVKIRGFRIELGEIENTLASHAAVKDAIVVAKASASGDKRLVAYAVTNAIDITDDSEAAVDARYALIESLRHHLSQTLPDYMVPSAFVLLDSLPLTPNGKVDRKALPEPDVSQQQAGYVAPRTETETLLCEIWQEVLGVERVGVTDNFFQLGGHSLLIMQVISRLQQRNRTLSVRQLFTTPTLADLALAMDGPEIAPAPVFKAPANRIPDACEQITPDMLPLVTLSTEEIATIVSNIPGGARNVQDIYPLAPLQEGILFQHMMSHQGDPYVLSSLFKIKGREAVTRFIASLQFIINRHDVLRTAIFWNDLSTPVQVVCREAQLPVTWLELDADIEAQMRARCAPAQQRLDLGQAPLLQLQIAVDADTQAHFVLLQFHHIISDHVGLEIIQKEIDLYEQGQADRLPTPFPYREFVAHAQHQGLHNNAESFFTRMLGDVDESTAPFDLVDVNGDGSRIVEARAEVPAEVSSRIRTLAKTLKVSPAALFHAAWAMVVSGCSGRDDVVFGTVLSGRLQGTVGAESMLGVFINTLPLRVQLNNVTALELIGQIHQSLLELLPYEQASLALAQQCSGVAGGAPLFSAMLNYRHSAVVVDESPDTDSVTMDDGEEQEEGFGFLAGQERTNYPFNLSVDDWGQQYGFGLDVQVDQLVGADRVIGYMQTAIAALVEALQSSAVQAMNSVCILPAEERQQLLVEFNNTAVDYPTDKCIHELFEAQANTNPDAIAVIFEGQHLTYQQLNTQANRLAHYLITEKQVKPDTLVGICVERSLEMVVGILAILKAGGAYVPLDPEYPEARLAYMLDDAKLTTVLTQRHLRETTPVSDEQAVCLDDETLQHHLHTHSTHNPDPNTSGLTSSHLAYVIYTSGSTGNPKGVLQTHQTISNLVQGLSTKDTISSPLKTLQFASGSFDVSVQEIAIAWHTGGTLFLISSKVKQNLIELPKVLRENKVERLFLPPAVLHWLAGSINEQAPLLHLKEIFAAGEALTVTESLAGFLNRHQQCQLWNHYGPTETHVATRYQVMPQNGPVPIGIPIPNLQTFVLNSQMEVAPIGVSGELLIGGVGLARGYLNRADLTAEKFIRNPFYDKSNPSSSERLYKTGDLVRWLPDGNLEYLGRIDHQVKIRGFRIELGEIENTLASHAAVKDAIVVAKASASGDKRLVAYVVTNAIDSADDSEAAVDARYALIESLRHHLSQTLPDYMVPSAFVLLDRLPLTPNGKVDRKALPEPDMAQQQSGYVAPRTDTEALLCEIWQEVLGVERVGVTDNFFHLGGNSLVVLRLIAHTNKVGMKINAGQIFVHQTIGELIKNKNIIKEESSVSSNETKNVFVGEVVLSASQKWFFDMDLIQPNWGEIGIIQLINEEIDPSIFEQALNNVITHHEMLRVKFELDGHVWKQIVVHPNKVKAPVDVYNLSHLMEEEQLGFIQENVLGSMAELNLANAPLIKIKLFMMGYGKGTVIRLCIHHLLLDGYSLDLFLGDLMSSYGLLESGKDASLPKNTVPTRKWLEFLIDYVNSERMIDEISYWRSLPWDKAASIPADYSCADQRNTESSMRVVHRTLSKNFVDILKEKLVVKEKIPFENLLVTALTQALTRFSKNEWLPMRVIKSARGIDDDHSFDLSRTLGWLTVDSVYMLRADESLGDAFSLLQSIQCQVQQIPNSGLGLSLLKYYHKDADVESAMRVIPKPEMTLNYFGDKGSSSVEMPSIIQKLDDIKAKCNWVNPENLRDGTFFCVAYIKNGELSVDWKYSENLHNERTIHELIDKTFGYLIDLSERYITKIS